jgi:hypothetical protein
MKRNALFSMMALLLVCHFADAERVDIDASGRVTRIERTGTHAGTGTPPTQEVQLALQLLADRQMWGYCSFTLSRVVSQQPPDQKTERVRTIVQRIQRQQVCQAYALRFARSPVPTLENRFTSSSMDT